MARKFKTNIHVGRGWGPSIVENIALKRGYTTAGGTTVYDPPINAGHLVKWRDVTDPLLSLQSYGTSPMSVVIGKVTYNPYRYKQSSGWTLHGATYPGYYTFSDAIRTRVTSNLVNYAINEAYSSLRDQKANISENIATLGQTIALLNGSWMNLFKSLLRILRILRRSRTPLTSLSDLWLEWVYGMAPLVSEIRSLLGIVREGLEKPMFMSVDETVRADENVKPLVNTFSYSGAIKVSVRFRLAVDVVFPENRALDQLGLLNPFSLLWELTPWSFLVDWFLPIGQVIGNISVGATYKMRYAFATHFTHVDITGVSVKPSNFVSGTLPSYRIQGLITKRVVYGALPRALPYIKFPNFSSRRTATALSLLHTVVRKYN